MTPAAVTPEVSFERRWFQSLDELEGADLKRVNRAVDQLLDDPDHPGLNLHPVRGDPTGRVHTMRASDELRILLAKEGNVYVLVEAGHHDAIYERARRLRFVANPHRGFVGLVDLPAAPGDEVNVAGRPAEPIRTGAAVADDARRVFDHWGDADLREAGFSDDEIGRLRACRTEDDLFGLDLDEETFNLLVELMEVTPEQWRAPKIDETAEAERRIRDAILRFGALSGVSQFFTPDEVAEIAAAPVEDWMIFLHPDQRTLIDRRYAGPARVRGSAGTGKTVVALHRAAALARRRLAQAPNGPGRSILFTTFVKSLTPVFEGLYRRMPGTIDGEVEFINVDKLAFKVCRLAGDRPFVNPKSVDAAFAAAHEAVVTPGSPLDIAGLTRGYLREEVSAVIKGRGVRSLAEYLTVERTGRRTRLPEPWRRQVWELHEEWDRQMALRKTVDFPDVVVRARDHARRLPEPLYAGAIIDEAQDLTLIGLQLVRALVNGPASADVHDGLLIVGDGAQRIYAGGFTLRQAGVEVRGRTTVLRTNYRNTREIIDAALAVASVEAVDDLGELIDADTAPAYVERRGIAPVLVLASGFEDEVRFIAEEIERLAGGPITHGDMAVAAPTNHQAKRIESTLRRMGVATQRLEDYDGRPTDRVKVGTHFRIKGLEFKVVFLPFLGAGDFPRPAATGQSASEYDEHVFRAVTQLYVAMTRARDGLFLLCSGEPSTVLDGATDRFELLET